MPHLDHAGSLGRRSSFEDVVSLACLGVAVVMAALTRLGWPGLVQFEYDESWALSVASSIARGQAFPLVGIGSSLNVPNAPFFVYLMAIPELIGRDPSIATGLVGLLGTAAVAATYGFVRTLFDPIVSGAAAILYAVSPWGIIYSRKVWEQDTLPIFVTLGFWALFAGVLRGKPRLIAPGVVLLALATQLHPTAFFLVVPAAILVIGSFVLGRSRSPLAFRWLVVGLLVAFAAEMPFLIWQVEHGWPTIEAFRHLARDPGQIDLGALRLASSAIAGSGYPLQAQVPNPWKPASFVEAALLSIGVVALGVRAFRPGPGAPRLTAITLLAWLVTPVLGQMRHSVPLYPHYFIVLYPVAFVVMGVGVSTLAGIRVLGPGRASGALLIRPRTIAAGLAAVTVLLPAILGVVAFEEYASALARGATLPEFGVPLGQQKAFYATANRLARGGAVYFGTHGSLSPTLGYLSGGSWRVFDDRQGLHLPGVEQRSILAIDDPASDAGQLARRWLGPEEVASLALSAQTTVTLYRLAPGGAETASGYRALDVPFSNGLTLSGFRVTGDRAGRKLSIDLHWRFDGPPPAKSPTVFNHLVDPRGETVSGVDGLAYAPSDWKEHEVFLDEFDLAWPAASGPYHLQVGLYDYPSMQRFRLLRPIDGGPIDWFDLGPVRLANDRTSL